MDYVTQPARKYQTIISGLLLAALLTACQGTRDATPATSPTSNLSVPASGGAPPSSTPNNTVQLYYSKGIVQGTNPVNPSVDLDHEEIKGMMPAMRMEFYVKDKAMLNGLKKGDKVTFTLEDNKGALMITALKK